MPAKRASQEEMYAFVTVADDQTTKGKGTCRCSVRCASGPGCTSLHSICVLSTARWPGSAAPTARCDPPTEKGFQGVVPLPPSRLPTPPTRSLTAHAATQSMPKVVVPIAAVRLKHKQTGCACQRHGANPALCPTTHVSSAARRPCSSLLAIQQPVGRGCMQHAALYCDKQVVSSSTTWTNETPAGCASLQ
eukprot:365145-Chlamydomonas_euryale.AAC.3